jgi:hypothetical protein
MTEIETETELIKNTLDEKGILYMKVPYSLNKTLKGLKIAGWCPERKLWYITKYTKLEKIKKIIELKTYQFESWGRVYTKQDPDVIEFPKYIQEDPDDTISVYDDDFKFLFKRYKKEEVLAMFDKPKEIKQIKQSVVSDFF